MIPQILMNVVQIGAKYLIDLDPSITEHLAKTIVFKAMAIAYSGTDVLLQLESKCASCLMPILDNLRSLKMHMSNT